MSTDDSDEQEQRAILGPRVQTKPRTHQVNSALFGGGISRTDIGGMDNLREDLWMSTYGGDRNLFDALGYVKDPDYEHYRSRYDRTDTAPAIVDKLPKKAWSQPKVKDTGAKDSESEFEKAVESFLSGDWTPEDPIEVMERASRMERLGQFSLIFLGLTDEAVAAEGAGADELEEPVDDDSLDALDDPEESLAYLTPYDQGRVDPEEIEWVDDDPTDPRFGKPRTYEVDLGDNRPTVRVHWQRVIHVVGNVFDDELKSDSVLKQSLNRIDDIEKILGASAEGYWRTAYQGLVISPPTINGRQGEFSDDGEELHRQIERYLNNMGREIFTGADIETIDSSTEDPSGHLESQYKDISAGYDIPQSILMGNETGERATSEDRSMWHERISEYREEFCKASVLRPLIQRLVDLNALPEPEGEFRIEWPSLEQKTETEEAELAKKIATAVKTGTGGKPLQAMTIPEFRQKVLGWKPERGSEVDVDKPDPVTSEDMQGMEVDEENPRVQEYFRDRGNAESSPISKIPVLPDGIFRIDRAWLIRWAQWVAAGRPDVKAVEQRTGQKNRDSGRQNEWNPALHPRDPDTGKFVERPFDVPSDAPDFTEMDQSEIVQYIVDNGGEQMQEVLEEETPVTIDGVDAEDVDGGDGGAGTDESTGGDKEGVNKPASDIEERIIEDALRDIGFKHSEISDVMSDFRSMDTDNMSVEEAIKEAGKGTISRRMTSEVIDIIEEKLSSTDSAKEENVGEGTMDSGDVDPTISPSDIIPRDESWSAQRDSAKSYVEDLLGSSVNISGLRDKPPLERRSALTGLIRAAQKYNDNFNTAPKSVSIEPESNLSRQSGYDSISGFYHWGEDSVKVSAGRMAELNSMKDEKEKVTNGGINAVEDPEATALHEMMHAGHARSVVDEATIKREGLTPEEEKLLEQEVSEYAAENPLEAVAEIATGLAYGAEYPPEIMELYRKFDGPEVEP